MTSLDFSGNGALSWSKETVDIAVGFSGTLFTDVYLDISNIPVMGYDQVYANVVGRFLSLSFYLLSFSIAFNFLLFLRSEPHHPFSTESRLPKIPPLSPSLFPTMLDNIQRVSLSNLTLFSKAVRCSTCIISSTKTVFLEGLSVVRIVSHFFLICFLHLSTTVDITLNIPIFSSTPYYVDFTTVVNKVCLLSSVFYFISFTRYSGVHCDSGTSGTKQHFLRFSILHIHFFCHKCTSLTFEVNVNTATTISINGDFAWLPLRQKTPVTWSAAGMNYLFFFSYNVRKFTLYFEDLL